MNIQIRESIISDDIAIKDITKQELGYDCPFEIINTKLKKAIASDREKVFVAVAEDKVVGYIHVENYDVLYYPHMKNLLGLAVYGDYQGKGVGTKLLEAVERWAADTGAHGVRLNSGKLRSDAHKFYRTRGYASEKEQIRFIREFK